MPLPVGAGVVEVSPEEADALYAAVQRLTLRQLLALWRWITLEVYGRLSREALPEMDAPGRLR